MSCRIIDFDPGTQDRAEQSRCWCKFFISFVHWSGRERERELGMLMKMPIPPSCFSLSCASSCPPLSLCSKASGSTPTCPKRSDSSLQRATPRLASPSRCPHLRPLPQPQPRLPRPSHSHHSCTRSLDVSNQQSIIVGRQPDSIRSCLTSTWSLAPLQST